MDTSAITKGAAVASSTSATPAARGASVAQTRTAGGDAQPVEKKAEAPAKEALKPQRDPRSLQFQVDGNRIVTTIRDENNNTVVEQIPDAEVIRLATAIDRLKGFFLQEKA